MELRKIRNAADATSCLRAVESSGQERAPWARKHGIDPRSLNMWRVVLGRTRATKPLRLVQQESQLQVVEITPVPEPVATYAVCVGPYRVEVDDSFDDGTLRRLLAVVSSC